MIVYVWMHFSLRVILAPSLNEQPRHRDTKHILFSFDLVLSATCIYMINWPKSFGHHFSIKVGFNILSNFCSYSQCFMDEHIISILANNIQNSYNVKMIPFMYVFLQF